MDVADSARSASAARAATPSSRGSRVDVGLRDGQPSVEPDAERGEPRATLAGLFVAQEDALHVEARACALPRGTRARRRGRPRRRSASTVSAPWDWKARTRGSCSRGRCRVPPGGGGDGAAPRRATSAMAASSRSLQSHLRAGPARHAPRVDTDGDRPRGRECPCRPATPCEHAPVSRILRTEDVALERSKTSGNLGRGRPLGSGGG